jgi:hypothetical protein
MLNRLQDVFKSFQRHKVRYVVIGGIASVLHGVPRATFDLDILIEATPENTRRLLNSLLSAGLAPRTLPLSMIYWPTKLRSSRTGSDWTFRQPPTELTFPRPGRTAGP